MSKGLIGALGLTVLALGASIATQEAAGQKVGKIAQGWLNNYPAARAAARQSGKPIFLVFR